MHLVANCCDGAPIPEPLLAVFIAVVWLFQFESSRCWSVQSVANFMVVADGSDARFVVLIYIMSIIYAGRTLALLLIFVVFKAGLDISSSSC